MNKPAPCPNAQNHTPAPSGYMQKHNWAHDMAKTHKQTRCPGCGLWAIWVPKNKKQV